MKQKILSLLKFICKEKQLFKKYVVVVCTIVIENPKINNTLQSYTN